MTADIADVPAPFAAHSVVEKLAGVDWDFPVVGALQLA